MAQLHPGGLFNAEVVQEELQAVMAVCELHRLALIGDVVQHGIILHLAEVEVGPLVHLRQELGAVEQVEPVPGLLPRQKRIPIIKSMGKNLNFCWTSQTKKIPVGHSGSSILHWSGDKHQ